MTALIRIDRSLTPGTGSDRSKPIRFCSRCGEPAEEPARTGERFPRERVCPRCGMGMMLACSRDAMPGTAAAFLVVTFDLRVSAVSTAGERIFGREQTLVGKPLLDVITSPLGDDQLARHAGQAAQPACEPMVMPVRLASAEADRVGTLAARIATCGPPRAALITVEPSDFGRR
jgi:ribosomal protein S27AE